MATAKATKAPAGDDGPEIDCVRLLTPGAHLEGSLTQLVRSAGKGMHRGWTLSEDERGVVASKEGLKSVRFPWSRIQQVEYV